jgi:hypothetical protein
MKTFLIRVMQAATILALAYFAAIYSDFLLG